MSFRIEENGQFRGQVTLLDAKLNDGCIADAQVDASAEIAATKLEHQHRANYAQESDTATVAEDRVVHVVHGTAGTIKAVKAGCVVACTLTATVTVDLHVNGASVMVAPIEIDSADAAYALVAGVIDDDVLAAGDVLEIVVTIATPTGVIGKGVFVYVDIFEDVD